MLLDEPFSALDTGLRASTRKATADLLAETGIASILVTHDQTEAAVVRHTGGGDAPGTVSPRWVPRWRFTRSRWTKRQRCFSAMPDPPRTP